MLLTKFKNLNEKLKEHICLCLASPALISERLLAPLYFMRDENMKRYIEKYNMRGHTNSLMFELIAGNYTKENVEDYFTDIEHGFLHGFCVSFWGFYLKQTEFVQLEVTDLPNFKIEKENYITKLFSCFLHDFLRTSRRGCLKAHHDESLKEAFPNLCDETYVHTRGEGDHELIVGDKIELHRYRPNSWIDQSLLPDHDKEEVEMFYNNIRPALEYYTLHQDETWFYHWFDTRKRDNPEWNFDGDFQCPQNTYTGRGWAASFFKGANLNTLYPAPHQDWQNLPGSSLEVALTCMAPKQTISGVSNWYLDFNKIRDRDHYVVSETKQASDFIIGYNSHYDIDLSKIIEGQHRFTESNVVLTYSILLHLMKTILEMHAK